MIQDAWGWCTGMTQRDGMGRKVGEGFRMGNTMATHSSVLAWRIPGTGEPDGLPSTGSHRVGHD